MTILKRLALLAGVIGALLCLTAGWSWYVFDHLHLSQGRALALYLAPFVVGVAGSVAVQSWLERDYKG